MAMHAGLGIWSPTALRGRLRATREGCALHYDIGWSLPARVLGCVSLGIFLLVLVGGAAAAVNQMVTGHANAAGRSAAAVSGALVATLLFFGMVAGVRLASRDQVALLHSWLRDRLQP
ncbi:hypothetical protein ACQP2P_02670 [Dactylosporangium sp. CA-139114]|uniref:hypothetical protein n=1 Tax=Dactylosporangium sp. CA-139114 TaxID=3239931 RepID=UPI003D97F544